MSHCETSFRSLRFRKIAPLSLKAGHFSYIIQRKKPHLFWEDAMQTTILLVEDDAVLRRGLAELFAREGYRVIEAASVREAKEKLNSEVQAVVLPLSVINTTK